MNLKKTQFNYKHKFYTHPVYRAKPFFIFFKRTFNNCILFVLSEKHSIKHAFILMQFNSCKHDTTAQMKEINTFNKQVCIKMIKKWQ